MNTKYLMIASSLLMGLMGVAASFLPQEIAAVAGIAVTAGSSIAIQLSGALYLGFAMMNWMAKTVLIGGIYSRPLAMGNFVHFMIGALVLLKATLKQPLISYILLACFLYFVFAALFGMVLFTNPAKHK